jgi:glycosyltransferase involved in cell wall biosynthesis
MKICVVTSRYAVTGVPIAQIRLARSLADKGHKVDLLIGQLDTEYELPEALHINVIVLHRRNARGMLLPLWRYFRRVNPDIVFSAEDNLNGIVLLGAITSGFEGRISCSSRVRPSDTYSNVILSRGWILKQLMRLVMWRADVLTCVSKDMVGQYREFFGSTSPHVYVYNIVSDKYSRTRMNEPVEHEWFMHKDGPVVIAAGTLAPWKGFADLIRAMAKVCRSRRARLLILGEGPLRYELENLVVELGLSDVVRLQGNVANPLKFFFNADIFVLSSYVEGLPNVLVEAMMCGCTPVSTDCPTGPREVLQNGKYGYLVPVGDSSAMSASIERALDYPISKSLLAEAIQPFEEEVVLKRHFTLLGLEYKEGMDVAGHCVANATRTGFGWCQKHPRP